MALEGSVHGFARNVVPVGIGFVIAQQDQSVVQASGCKLVNFTINDWRQTDTGVANSSEGHQPGVTVHVSLGNVVEADLRQDEG